MRILTVRQPWAWAIIHGGKDVENRVRNIAGSYRGPIAIHSAATTVAAFDGRHADLWPFDMQKHVFGAIIGVIELVDVHHDDGPGPYDDPNGCCASTWHEDGQWHLVLANPRPLAEPIPYRGGRGLRRLNDADVLRRLGEVL